MLTSIGSSRAILSSLLRPNAVINSRPLVSPLRSAIRSFASVVPNLPATTSSKSSPHAAPPTDGQLRPSYNVPVNPDHGLYAFFRKNVAEDGAVSYETVEQINHSTDNSGRSWTAAELRRKSFKDLHTLWYVLLRERNLLATQKAEIRRLGGSHMRTPITPKLFRVRKSMARIKYVVNERRLAYEGAVKIFTDNREAGLAEKREKKEAYRQLLADKADKEAKVKAKAEAEARREAGTEEGKAASLAAHGLFDVTQR
ncbi:hypothetical protein PHLCEN_2v9506 [Hermanssonia centrifuga]|uniref:Large ribosomal subunit protein uL29m n=1 Tax=Hermanssonia centrifuga TaxID=98765 RepID=A0A2R6NQG1_9APHY|nr:hypothetical protein PHLCEN_2v9506 [Hermanssonia centrifuga]